MILFFSNPKTHPPRQDRGTIPFFPMCTNAYLKNIAQSLECVTKCWGSCENTSNYHVVHQIFIPLIIQLSTPTYTYMHFSFNHKPYL